LVSAGRGPNTRLAGACGPWLAFCPLPSLTNWSLEGSLRFPVAGLEGGGGCGGRIEEAR
jgi:hypothetical protein